jgi:hypothetical protein
VATVAGALAVGGSVWVLVDPHDVSYLVGGLMILPLFAVLMAREDSDPTKSVPPVGDPAGDLPPFP